VNLSSRAVWKHRQPVPPHPALSLRERTPRHFDALCAPEPNEVVKNSHSSQHTVAQGVANVGFWRFMGREKRSPSLSNIPDATASPTRCGGSPSPRRGERAGMRGNRCTPDYGCRCIETPLPAVLEFLSFKSCCNQVRFCCANDRLAIAICCRRLAISDSSEAASLYYIRLRTRRSRPRAQPPAT